MARVVLDTSVIIALLASDEERQTLLEHISVYEFVCSSSIYPEIGNAISAMFKRGRITLSEGMMMIDAFELLGVHILPLNIHRALEISEQYSIYAYDAYILECAERLRLPLMTFDVRMKAIAEKLGISLIEV